MLQGFKQFIFRGNVLDLAVAVVMGGAFGAVAQRCTDCGASLRILHFAAHRTRRPMTPRGFFDCQLEV